MVLLIVFDCNKGRPHPHPVRRHPATHLLYVDHKYLKGMWVVILSNTLYYVQKPRKTGFR